MPLLEFYYKENGRQYNCAVDTEKGIPDPDVRSCLRNVAKQLESDNRHNMPARLIYIAHGWQFYIPLVLPGEDWQLEMKDAILNQQYGGRTVVCLIRWQKAARFWFWTKNAGRSLKRSVQVQKPKLTLLSKFFLCCAPSNFINYLNAALNAWPTGRVVGYAHKRIVQLALNQDLKSYCIGFSLGGHLCGFFGKMVQTGDFAGKKDKLYKIIALDPAGPIFDQPEQSPSVRLHKDDAEIVEVFHTGAKVFGFKNSIGDRDFYINGGGYQPWCYQWSGWKRLVWDLMEAAVVDVLGPEVKPITIAVREFIGMLYGMSCSHTFAYKFMIHLERMKTDQSHKGCSAHWKCGANDGHLLLKIPKENPKKLEKHCKMLAPKDQPDLGSLGLRSTGSALQMPGVYWVNVNDESKTCSVDASGD